jgi:hypothetical protein
MSRTTARAVVRRGDDASGRARRDDLPPDQLIALALDLLGRAGALEPLLTPREAADLVPIGVEAVRCWCRDGLGFYDRRLHTFLIPLPEQRAFVLVKRGSLSNALAADFTSTQMDLEPAHNEDGSCREIFDRSTPRRSQRARSFKSSVCSTGAASRCPRRKLTATKSASKKPDCRRDEIS